jgi:hypothetical protein
MLGAVRAGRVAFVAVTVLTAMAKSCGGGGSPPVNAPNAGASAVYRTGMRDICHLPQTGNTAGALGADVGTSFASAGKHFWLFGDTWINADGTGLPGGTLRTGTIASSVDNDASDCVDMSFKSGTDGFAANAIQPDNAIGECLTWPAGAGVDVNGTPYYYYTSVVQPNGCGTTPNVYSTGVVSVNPSTMATTKHGILWPSGGREYTTPVVVAGNVYVFAVADARSPDDGSRNIYMARAPLAQLTQLGAYTYFSRDAQGGTHWTTTESQATPFYQDPQGTYSAPPSIAYNAKLARFLAIYSCGFALSQVCARTAINTGSSSDALVNGFNDDTVVFYCGRCGHAAQHADYYSTASPGTIYLTTARHYCNVSVAAGSPCPRTNQRYYVTLRALDLDSVARSNVTIADATPDWDPQGQQGVKRWTYRTYTPPGFAQQLLSWSGAPNDTWTNTNADAPRVGTDVSYSGGSQSGAVRAWTVPATGSLQISGQVWLQGTCGDGAWFRIVQLTQNPPAAVDVIPATRLAGPWSSAHAYRFDKTINVTQGQEIDFWDTHVAPESSACDEISQDVALQLTA